MKSGSENTIVSKLQMVDLAGSERASLTGNQSVQHKQEAIEINKSLFTLRQVITALTENNQKRSGLAQTSSNFSGAMNTSQQQYIPYRDSKLTCLLKQSLGGNSYCLMIACLNPCDAYLDENISTLQYAARASYISNKPVRNEDPRNRLIEELKQQNRILT